MELPPELALIHQPQRLRIMGLLYKQRDVAFTRLRDLLGLTDGNLSTHATKLQEAGYLEGRKVLMREGFEMRYRITMEGNAAFQRYLAALQGFLADHDGAVAGGTEATAAARGPTGRRSPGPGEHAAD